MKQLALILSLLLFSLPMRPDIAESGCPMKAVEAEELPSLNIPRAGHSLMVAGGEPVVVGGHTSGFVPTATAEYFADGQWHLIETVYAHDQGFSLPLRSGKVLIGGGHAEPLGIGQLFSVEIYDPATHSFHGFGCLDRKRCFATAAEMDSGRVVITGSWYSSDGLEMFDGQKYFTAAADVTQARACPYVLRTSDGDVLVFSRKDVHDKPFDTIWVDRLKGSPMLVPLFDEWKPLRMLKEMHCDDALVDRYAYLFPVEDRTGQVAIALAEDTVFSLLPTANPVPMDCNGNRIEWYNSIVVEGSSDGGATPTEVLGRCAYLSGYCPDSRQECVLAIDLSTTPATLTLLYTDTLRYAYFANPVLTADGDLLFAGGTDMSHDGCIDNFSPHATVLLLRVGRHGDYATEPAILTAWLWPVLALIFVVLIVLGLLLAKRVKKEQQPQPSQDKQGTNILMERLFQLMDEQKPYLNANLKLQDVADMLGTNRTYITNIIKETGTQSFSLFVNTYRVGYAQQLLLLQPDMKMSAVASEAGFSSDTSFFRTFKAITGTTPKEWLAKNATKTE